MAKRVLRARRSSLSSCRVRSKGLRSPRPAEQRALRGKPCSGLSADQGVQVSAVAPQGMFLTLPVAQGFFKGGRSSSSSSLAA